ncbi:PTS fructose transporter subunit IIA [Streptomyces sp. PvR034]|uniref:PTS-dependent dihydroxyacetone kinase phosphotransferase subunit DhaM n=1 Tax=Streptomyces sp. PvR034 TaxID=3156401 RepID=UPI0033923E26
MEALRTAVDGAADDIDDIGDISDIGTEIGTDAAREAVGEEPLAEEPVAGEGRRAGAGVTTGRVGVVLVSHSKAVAESVAELTRALLGSAEPGPLALAGGTRDGGIGTSAALVREAVRAVDEGRGVAVLCDMGSAVLTVKSLIGDEEAGLPAGTRIVDAPFLEGAVAITLTSAIGADLDAVLAAAADARDYRKR